MSELLITERIKRITERIKREKNRLKKEFKNIPKERFKTVEKLIDRAAFMLVSLEDMENIINTEGKIVEMKQGSYSIDRTHPLMKDYNVTVKNYASVIKQLIDMLPAAYVDKTGNELLGFITAPKVSK